MSKTLNYIFNLCLILLIRPVLISKILTKGFKVFEAYQADDWIRFILEIVSIIILIKGVVSRSNKK